MGINEIMTFTEAAKLYGMDSSNLRHALIDKKFKDGEIRRSGGTWLITISAMERLYGNKKKLVEGE